MINVLPPDIKRQIVAARSNVLLSRYIIISMLLAGLLFALTIGTHLMLGASKQTAEETIKENTLKQAGYQDTKLALKEFSDNLATAKAILDKEVKYSAIAIRLAQGLPRGVNLQSLDLKSDSFGEPMTLTVLGNSHNDAARIKDEFNKSTVFKDAFILSTSEAGGEGEGGGKGVNIELSVTIRPEIVSP